MSTTTTRGTRLRKLGVVECRRCCRFQGTIQRRRQRLQNGGATDPADPADPFVPFDLGVVAPRLALTAEARSDFRQALHLNLRFTSAMFNLAILDTPSDPTTAVSWYRRIIALNPKLPTPITTSGPY